MSHSVGSRCFRRCIDATAVQDAPLTHLSWADPARGPLVVHGSVSWLRRPLQSSAPCDGQQLRPAVRRRQHRSRKQRRASSSGFSGILLYCIGSTAHRRSSHARRGGGFCFARPWQLQGSIMGGAFDDEVARSCLTFPPQCTGLRRSRSGGRPHSQLELVPSKGAVVGGRPLR